MDGKDLSDLRQVIAEELSVPLKSLITRMDQLHANMEDWRQSSEDRLASFKSEQAMRSSAI